MVDIQNQIWTGWNKRSIRNKQIIQPNKVSPKAFKVTTFTSAYKKEVKYIQRNVTTLQQHIKWLMCHEYQHLLNSCDGHTNAFW
jgi:hypothetical protein